jgi:hypothetical protein
MIVDRPLKLGEFLAETVRLYGERLWAAAGIGAFLGGAVLAAGILGELILVIAVIALALRSVTPPPRPGPRSACGPRFSLRS